jgi:hypothetical protein
VRYVVGGIGVYIGCLCVVGSISFVLSTSGFCILAGGFLGSRAALGFGSGGNLGL